MALIERTQRNVDATSWPGEIPMNYIYTAGRAGEVFLAALRDKGTFLGSKCDACGTVVTPPQIFCERCFGRTEGNTIELPNRGVVHTFSVCHETYDEAPKEEPSVVVMVRLEGAEGGIFHRLEGVDPAEVFIGMRVEAVFRPKKERTGSILDIAHFKPVE